MINGEKSKDFAHKAVEASYPDSSLWFEPPILPDEGSDQTISKDDFGIRTSSADPVKLEKLVHVSGVNRLKNGTVLEFDPTLMTVVFGANGAGKSGYTRILKKFAASRGREEILPNALSEESCTAEARITYSEGQKRLTATWKQEQESVDSSFQRVRVFDSRSAQTQIRDAQAVAYVPPQIEVLTHFVSALDDVKSCIEDERQALAVESTIPMISDGSQRIYSLVEKLGSAKAREEIEQISNFSESQQKELMDLEQQLVRMKAGSPERLAQLAQSQIDAIATYENTLGRTDDLLERLDCYQAAAQRADADRAEEQVKLLKRSLENADRLELTISDDWLQLWQMAQELYPNLPLEHPTKHETVEEWDACPVCQQDLSESAKKRLIEFAKFSKSEAYNTLQQAQEVLRNSGNLIDQVEVVTEEEAKERITSLINHLELSEDDANLFKDQFIRYCKAVTDEVADVKSNLDGRQLQWRTSADGSRFEDTSSAQRMTYKESLKEFQTTLAKAKDRFECRKSRLQESSDNEDGDLSIVARIQDLEYHRLKSQHRDTLRNMHDAKLRDMALEKALEKCKPTRATNLVKRLSNEFISRIAERFSDELYNLGFDRSLPVKLVLDKTQKGVSYIRTTVESKQKGKAHEILSEGEQRIASLAGFFADLTGSNDASCLIFDDPVSSLDHRFRERVATRLVEESLTRQVVVFSHDYAFVRLLEQAVNNLNQRRRAQGIAPIPDLDEKEIFRTKEGAGDLFSGGWRKRKLSNQVGALKARLQEVEALERKDPGKYREAAESLLAGVRETWEREVEENLLNGVVTRHNRAVHTQQLRGLTDITDCDLATIELGMGNASQLFAGHSDSGEVTNEGFPTAARIREEVERLVEFDKAIKKRRS